MSRGARLFVRNALSDHHLDSSFYEFFDAARRIDRVRLSVLADLRTRVALAGFAELHNEVVHQITDTTLNAFESRMRSRPFSTFELMTEAEIEAGFSRLASAIAEDGARPAIEYVDLIVLEAV